MTFYRLFFVIGFVFAASGCGARIVSLPVANSSGGETLSQAETGVSGSIEPTASGGIAPAAVRLDPAPVVTEEADTGPYLDTAETNGPTTPTSVAEPPAFLAEAPEAEHSGEVPVLVDAPIGSTVTYSLDRNDPIEAEPSFVIEELPPGEHSLEIIVKNPEGEAVVLEHSWTQLPSSDRDKKSDSEKVDEREKRKKKYEKSKERRRHEKRKHKREHERDRDEKKEKDNDSDRSGSKRD